MSRAHSRRVESTALLAATPNSARSRADDSLVGDITAEATQIRQDLIDFYGLPKVPFDVFVSDVPDGRTIASAAPVDVDDLPGIPQLQPQGTFGWCRITVYPSGLEIYQKVTDGSAPEYDLGFLAHELYHCTQASYGGDVARWNAAPDWLTEGSAMWAEDKWVYDSTHTDYDVGLPGELEQSRTAFWNDYLGQPAEESDQPQRSLYAMDYPAGGFYAHLENTGLNPWRVIPAMSAAVTTTRAGSNMPVLEAAVPDGAAASFWQDWAMGLVRDPDVLGDEWDTTGPGIPRWQPDPPDHTVSGALDSGGVMLTSQPAAAERHDIGFADTDNKVLTTAEDGYGAIAWVDAGGESADERFSPGDRSASCLDPEGCTCEDGTPVPDDLLDATPVDEPDRVVVALTGGTRMGSVVVELVSAEDLCEPPDDEEQAATGTFRPCRVVTGRQVGQLIGTSMTAIPTINEGCMWSSLGVAADDEAILLLIGVNRPDDQVAEWEVFRDEFTANLDADCTRLIAGMRACIVEDEDEPGSETSVYVWAGEDNAAFVTLRAGTAPTAAVQTQQQRVQVADTILRAMFVRD